MADTNVLPFNGRPPRAPDFAVSTGEYEVLGSVRPSRLPPPSAVPSSRPVASRGGAFVRRSPRADVTPGPFVRSEGYGPAVPSAVESIPAMASSSTGSHRVRLGEPSRLSTIRTMVFLMSGAFVGVAIAMVAHARMDPGTSPLAREMQNRDAQSQGPAAAAAPPPAAMPLPSAQVAPPTVVPAAPVYAAPVMQPAPQQPPAGMMQPQVGQTSTYGQFGHVPAPYGAPQGSLPQGPMVGQPAPIAFSGMHVPPPAKNSHAGGGARPQGPRPGPPKNTSITRPGLQPKAAGDSGDPAALLREALKATGTSLGSDE